MYTTLLSCEELNEQLGKSNLVVIDCRFSLADKESGRKAHTQSHIPGAHYAHLDEDLSSAVIPGKTGRHPLPSIEAATRLFSSWGISAETQVVAYDDKSGAIAARLWWMLRWLGHDKVAVLEGGWKHWMHKELPTESAVPSKVPGHVFVANPRQDLLVNVEFVETVQLNPDYKIADSRTPERYRGEFEPIDPIAGHIPGAVNIPHPGNVKTDGLWLDKDSLKERFKNVLGEVPADKTIFYCGSGVTACRNLLAHHHAGLGEAKLYPGSWSEWIQSGEREIVKNED